jgi:DNA-binding NarL/FixJ family response regulator
MEPSRTRIVIIDDSDLIRGLLWQILEKIEGVEIVGQAATGETGVARVRELRPDIVTLDLRLNGVSGMAVLQEIQTLPDRPMVIVLTDYPFSSYRRRCLELGAAHFLDKASEIPKLAELIRDHRRAASA